MAIPHHSPTTTASVDKFLAARKDFLEWRAAKQKALQLAEKRFPDNKSLRRCVASLCCGNLLSEWTLAADNAACALADRVGDEPFVRTASDVQLLSPADYFYEHTLVEHDRVSADDAPHRPADKTSRAGHLSIDEAALFHNAFDRVSSSGDSFMRAVEALLPLRRRRQPPTEAASRGSAEAVRPSGWQGSLPFSCRQQVVVSCPALLRHARSQLRRVAEDNGLPVRVSWLRSLLNARLQGASVQDCCSGHLI